MKAFTYLLLLIVLAGGGGGAYFYFRIHDPMAKDYARMKIGQPGYEQASAELRKYRLRAEWTPIAVSTLQASLQKEIAEGKAEVVAAFDAIVVNIDESVLYTPGSVTFSKDSPEMLDSLASVLKNLKDMKDKDIFVGNTTGSTKAQRVGRKKIPARAGRDIAADRSVALVKALEKRGVPEESLAAAAYAPQQPDRGFKIRDRKTVIIITPPLSPVPGVPAAQAKPAVAAPAAAPPAPKLPPGAKPIPILPGPPRAR